MQLKQMSTGQLKVGLQTYIHTIDVVVSCLATGACVRILNRRHWFIRGRRVEVASALTLEVLAHEHPLAHGICGQLLRILDFTEFDGIDGHAEQSLEKGMGENVKYGDLGL